MPKRSAAERAAGSGVALTEKNVRKLRPGYEGYMATISSHMPPPPEGFVPPSAWGTREHVEGLFEGTGVGLEFAEDETWFEFESAEHAVEVYAKYFGPVVQAKEALGPEGKWDALAQDLVTLFESEGELSDSGLSYLGEYLVTLGAKAG